MRKLSRYLRLTSFLNKPMRKLALYNDRNKMKSTEILTIQHSFAIIFFTAGYFVTFCATCNIRSRPPWLAVYIEPSRIDSFRFAAVNNGLCWLLITFFTLENYTLKNKTSCDNYRFLSQFSAYLWLSLSKIEHGKLEHLKLFKHRPYYDVSMHVIMHVISSLSGK